MNYSISLDLGKMNGVKLVSIDGEKSLLIPLKANHLEKNEKGRVYIPCTMWERTDRETGEVRPDEHGSTHYLRVAYPKEVRENLAEGERIPYIGNAYPVKPRGEEPIAKETIPADKVQTDDLPW